MEFYLISPIAGQTGDGCQHKELPYTSSGQWTSKNNIAPEICLAAFTVFVQKACQIPLGYLLAP